MERPRSLLRHHLERISAAAHSEKREALTNPARATISLACRRRPSMIWVKTRICVSRLLPRPIRLQGAPCWRMFRKRSVFQGGGPRKIIRHTGLSQKDLATGLRIESERVAKWERNERSALCGGEAYLRVWLVITPERIGLIRTRQKQHLISDRSLNENDNALMTDSRPKRAANSVLSISISVMRPNDI